MFLELICFLCGAALAVSGSITFWPIHNWWDFYIPIVLYTVGWIAGIGVIFLIELVACLFVNPKKEYNKVNRYARFWFLTGLRFIANHAHIWVDMHGEEKIPDKERFVIVCNHRSKFDNFVISNKFGKKDIAFITKKENKKILIAGRLFPALCYISIDREDKLQSLEAFKRAVTLLNDNVTSIGVFPEGTRQTEKVIGEFHEGPFNIAIHAKAPIVVSTLVNTDRVAKNWPLKPTTVRFDIISIISYEEYQGMTAKAVSDMVHNMMEEHLKKVRGL